MAADTESASRLFIGTAGWNYPSGAGTWNGVFYPKPRPRQFDELAFYAEYFNFVEINSTFYGQPRPDVSSQWAARTPPGFLFSAKLYQQFTHPRMFRERVERDLARQLGTNDLPDEAIEELVKANQTDLDEFRRGIDPLASSGKLGPLLAQFPASFRDTPASRLHLAALLRAFHGYAVAVELRHRSWSDRAGETRALLDAFHASWVWIDEPRFHDSIRQPAIIETASAFAYVRMHGRNAQQWWRHQHKDDRYNYLYSSQELEPITEELRTVLKRNLRTYAAFNNHPRAAAVANAAQTKHLLNQLPKRAYPASLLAAYPELSQVVASPTASAVPDPTH